MNSFKSLALGVALVAIVAPMVCVDWTSNAQKTAANSYQQSVTGGSNPNSVYGGYQTSSVRQQQRKQSSSNFVAPVNQQRRTQTYESRQQTETVNRQPAYQQQQQQPQQQQQQQDYSSDSSSASGSYDQAEADAEPASYGAVAGKPGQDFPAYTQVPKTSFSCDGLPYDYGMYADEETGCQAYHVCYNGRKDSFLCGVGTVFNQRILHCDYWYSVDCGKSSQYYGSNAYMGSSQPEPGPAEANAAPARQPQQQASSSSSYSQQASKVASSSINRPTNYQRPQQQSQSFRNTQQQQEESY